MDPALPFKLSIFESDLPHEDRLLCEGICILTQQEIKDAKKSTSQVSGEEITEKVILSLEERDSYSAQSPPSAPDSSHRPQDWRIRAQRLWGSLFR